MIILPYHDYYPHQWDFFKNCVFGDKRFAYIRWCRRAGKDDCFINALCIKMQETVGLYAYILPYYSQVRKTVWENIGEDGKRFIDYFPDELVERRRDQDMTIIFKNGSILKFVGSDNFESLRGWNPIGIVQAEYQDHRPQANADLLPIIIRNNGFMWKNGVHPETRNHAYQLWNNAINEGSYFTSEETWHTAEKSPGVPLYTEEQKRLAKNEMKQEEIDTNFEMRLPAQSERYIYSKIMNNLHERKQILDFHLDSRLPCDTYWDLGVSNVYASMAIWVIQDAKTHFNAVAYFDGCGHGVVDYIEIIKEFCTKKNLRLGRHFCPHDGVNNKDYFEGKSLIGRAAEFGVKFECPVSMKSVKSGIQNVIDILPQVFIHKSYCESGIAALEQYQRMYDKTKNVYGAPLHDEFSHGSDAFRYFAQIKSRRTLKVKENLLDSMFRKDDTSQVTQKFRRIPGGD